MTREQMDALVTSAEARLAKRHALEVEEQEREAAKLSRDYLQRRVGNVTHSTIRDENAPPSVTGVHTERRR